MGRWEGEDIVSDNSIQRVRAVCHILQKGKNRMMNTIGFSQRELKNKGKLSKLCQEDFFTSYTRQILEGNNIKFEKVFAIFLSKQKLDGYQLENLTK